jgi:hypothetical protein
VADHLLRRHVVLAERDVHGEAAHERAEPHAHLARVCRRELAARLAVADRVGDHLAEAAVEPLVGLHQLRVTARVDP